MRRADNVADQATPNDLSKRILGAAFNIHTALGHGLCPDESAPLCGRFDRNAKHRP